MADWYWKNNFLFSMLAVEACVCRKLTRRNASVVYWVLLTGVMLAMSSGLMENWEWLGNTIAADNMMCNILWRAILSMLSAFQIFLCYEVSCSNALYLMVISITFQRIQFDFYKILESVTMGYLHGDEPGQPAVALCLTTLAVACLFARAIFSDRETLLFKSGSKNTGVVVCAMTLLIVNDAYNMFLFVYDPHANVGITMVVIRIYAILFDILTICVLYNLTVRRTLEMERVATETMAKQHMQQYESSRELMQMINIKSHDLKKQLRYLRQDPDGKTQLIEELEHITGAFDAIVDTNNEALSTVLTEKSATCLHEKIPFTVVSCEHPLEFMRELDLYTLFANLLDNAIEASRKLEPSRRSITLAIKCSQGFLSIHQENYFDGKIQRAGPELLTTKADSTAHGFGFQSMSQIVEQYHGIINYKTNEDVFSVNILIPLPENSA